MSFMDVAALIRLQVQTGLSDVFECRGATDYCAVVVACAQKTTPSYVTHALMGQRVIRHSKGNRECSFRALWGVQYRRETSTAVFIHDDEA